MHTIKAIHTYFRTTTRKKVSIAIPMQHEERCFIWSIFRAWGRSKRRQKKIGFFMLHGYIGLCIGMLAFSAQAEEAVFSLTQLKKTIKQGLQEKGMLMQNSSRLDIIISGYTKDLSFPELSAPLTAELADLSIHRPSNQFTATLLFQDITTRPAQEIRVHGHFEEWVQVPVLSSRLATGDTIKYDDIAMLSVRTTMLQRHAITARNQLEDKIAKHTLLPYTVLNMYDVSPSYRIQRNSLVTVIYESGGLTITDRAIALEAGIAGDVIRLRNAKSTMTLHGVVQKNGTVISNTPFAMTALAGKDSHEQQ